MCLPNRDCGKRYEAWLLKDQGCSTLISKLNTRERSRCWRKPNSSPPSLGMSLDRPSLLGLYRQHDSSAISLREFWRIPENQELRKYGMTSSSRPLRLWFDLREDRRLSDFKARLVVRWGAPGSSERVWCRWASKNEFRVMPETFQRTVSHTVPAEDDEDGNRMIEDLSIIREHKRLERDPSISIKVKKALGYRCQACGFRFQEMYPGIQDARYIEAHHLIPAWSMRGRKVVHKDPKANFAVLCANCHRMIHRFERPGNLAAFRRTIRNR